MRNSPLIIAIVAVAFSCVPDAAAAQTTLPEDHEYQRVLRAYLATLKEQDFAVEPKPFTAAAGLSEDELFKAWLFVSDPAYGGIYLDAVAAPPAQFTLTAIESKDAVLCPAANAMQAAMLAGYEYPGNPYYRSRSIKNRAFVLAVIDMLMFDRLYESQPRVPSARSDFFGGTLIWLAYVYGLCKDDLPAEVREAYETGLKRGARRLEAWGPRGAMTDMDLFASVSLGYLARYTGDPEMADLAERYVRPLYTTEEFFHPAGYFVDCHCFDTSYNGISLYFAGWAALSTPWPFVDEAVDKAFRLRGYLCLPEPGGRYFGPTHFSARCSGDSFGDQWGWNYRNVGAAMTSDHALAFIKMPSPEELQAAPAQLANMLNNAQASLQAGLPQPWNDNRHWTSQNYAAVHGQPGFYARWKRLSAERSPLLTLPWERAETFIENFADTLLVAKRRGFGVVIHTGQVGGDDWRWHRPLGLGGGALSAFWTPEAGPVLLGRRRGIQGNTFDTYDDWRVWPTHAITGITAEGKVVSSARNRTPQAEYDVRSVGATVRVRGTMPATSAQGLPRAEREDPVGPPSKDALPPGQVLRGSIGYERTFTLDDQGLSIETSLQGDGEDKLAELYEVIPVFLGDGYARRAATVPSTDIHVEVAGKWRPASADPIDGVGRIRVDRLGGAVLITLDKPARVRLSPEDWVDGYMTSATCRNVMIDLLATPTALLDKPAVAHAHGVRYRIEPAARP